jgi:hypothetical protein
MESSTSLNVRCKKLVDYTQHRRDDMPSMSDSSIGKDDDDDGPHTTTTSSIFNHRKILSRRPLLFDISSRSSLSPIDVHDVEDTDTTIDFLFKVPSCRRRSSELSRAQLIQECEKRIEHHDEQESGSGPTSLRARRHNNGETGRRGSLIARILLRKDIDDDDIDDDDDDDDASSTTVVTYHRRRRTTKP